jgi:hypothetical protein
MAMPRNYPNDFRCICFLSCVVETIKEPGPATVPIGSPYSLMQPFQRFLIPGDNASLSDGQECDALVETAAPQCQQHLQSLLPVMATGKFLVQLVYDRINKSLFEVA